MRKITEKITAKVFRFNPEVDDRPRFKTYEVETVMPLTVQNILRHIQENLDPTLAFRNYICLSGICGSCFVKVNEKIVRGCQMRVDPGEKVVIEPRDGHPVIRDVVTEFGLEVFPPDMRSVLKGETSAGLG